MGALDGKVALVTGGNRGLGEAIARGLAAAGATVAVGARVLADGAKVARAIGGRAFAVALDVADDRSCADAVEETARRGGGLQVLVNNAGVKAEGDDSTAAIGLADFDRQIAINLRAPLHLIQLALPHLRRAGWGRIVNISSGLSRMTGGMSGAWAGYRVSKAGLNALTRNLATEVRAENILVNAIDPGWVKTRMGGAGAPRTVEEGADTAIWAACLPDDGPSGELLHDRKPTPF